MNKFFTFRPIATDKLFFPQQRPNFNSHTVSFLLSMVHANVKNYRSGLFNFRLNIVYLIPGLPEGHLPISIIPIVSFLMIMDKVFVRQSKPANRLTVAISAGGFLSHMISCFLVDTIALSEEPLLTFNIPLA